MNQKNTENNLDKSKINVEKNKNYNEFYEEIDISKLNVGKNIKEEINLYYIKLQRSNNPKELKIFYNKLIFYLKLANIDENVRKNIIIDLNRIINSKKFS